MTDRDENELIDLHQRRMRWFKRLLRWMPRRSNVHRYPGLSWFAEAAKKRMYLWSFSPQSVTPAIYAGTILSLLPVFGIQLPLACIGALLLRANLPIFVALQFITNWLTIVPIYYICYQIGRLALLLVAVHVEPLTMEQLREFMENCAHSQWAENGIYLAKVFAITSLGSLILGLFVAVVFDFAFKLMRRRMSATWQRVRAIHATRRLARHAAKSAHESGTDTPPMTH
jgi:uncharacterized protein (DUF2062 family)